MCLKNMTDVLLEEYTKLFNFFLNEVGGTRMAKDNKTEKATPQKRKKSREEGNIARSKDLNNLFSIFVLAVVVYFFGDWLGYEIANSVAVLFDQIGKKYRFNRVFFI